MRNIFLLILCAIILAPTAALAQRRCDGGGKLLAHLSGSLDGPSASAIAEIWVNAGVPSDVDPASTMALRTAIEAFEGPRPNAEQAAAIAAGDWTGWRAKLMSRNEFISGFLDEVRRRSGSHGEYAAILQAAEAMRNRLDDMYGAAGKRGRPEDPSAMWIWDLTMRKPAAQDQISTLLPLPDGEWLWNRYLRSRKAVIACALDDMSELTKLAETVDKSLFLRPDVVTSFVAGRKFPLDYQVMAYLSGLLEVRLPDCKLTAYSDGMGSVLTFQQATIQSAMTSFFDRGFDLGGVVFDSMEFVAYAKAGKADAKALQEKYGCTSPVALAFAKGFVRTVRIDATASSDSLFVQSCSVRGLSLKQCACLAELGRGVAPQIEKMGYDPSTTIKWITERNSIVTIQLGLLCQIGNY